MNCAEYRENYDVVIVGAGPAGAATAQALKGSGLNVLIAEKQSLPRDKMCSGIIFPSSVKFIGEHFGEIPDTVLCEPREIKGNRVFLTNESECMEVGFDAFDPSEELPSWGLNARREGIDHWLCSLSGADMVGDCLFKGYQVKDHNIHMTFFSKGEGHEIVTRYLIGADGPQSRVRSCVNPAFDGELAWLPLYEEWYEGSCALEPGWLYVFFDRRVTGYLATLFHKDSAMHVTTGVRPGESPKDYHKALVNYLVERHKMKIDRSLKKRRIILNDMSGKKNYNMGAGNVILAGEAAGFLRGAEGITSALTTGWAAGESVRRSQESGESALEYYGEHDLVTSERQRCESVHSEMEAVLGFNVFMRE